MTAPTDVYLCSAASGDLLYVGVSLNAARRLGQHRGASWWDQVEKVEIERLPDRPSALEREASLIRSRRPRHNQTGRVRQPALADWAVLGAFLPTGSAIKVERVLAGVTQTRVAAAVGISIGHLSRIESGERTAAPELIERIRVAIRASRRDAA